MVKRIPSRWAGVMEEFHRYFSSGQFLVLDLILLDWFFTLAVTLYNCIEGILNPTASTLEYRHSKYLHIYT
ncbi:hypothetical protein P175DRAFT_0501947 [Aspergillus ochraceoroseus IBT 24754]|uniref:Uncharacterized protein n=1 Tax=Aspergillus ochraceoroseus IBT 24754 TaxID=1392256 RepID=A0A2T5LU22_9EURO|nr:uncharacterized protein P175DRAFT_0501947 [Aspergillus ochraceoroseus IBT 24754]PTU19782.1 hypothetical protein P175DRAFT_0501947 [Aspergillus ochraceoroseus IBT 24754]